VLKKNLDETLVVSNDETRLTTSADEDEDKTQLSNALVDDDKTQLSGALKQTPPNDLLIDGSLTDPSSPSRATAATKTLVRRYQRSSSGDLEIGSVIRDRFIIEKLLGSGGMGSVYRAVDLRKKEARDEQPYVALKVLRGNFQFHKSAFIALQREAKKTQVLAHPNIITVYDFDRDDDLIFVTMEELKGDALNDIIRGRTNRVLTEKDKVSIVEQIALGLSHAHAKGLVHSDLKPANIFLTDDGTVKILDFGIARAANEGQYQDNFDAGSIGALTEAYASLEMWQFKDPHPSDDVYALGIIACELLHGAHPYKRKSAMEVFEKKLSHEKFKISNPFVRNVIRKAVSLQRDHRIVDAKTFLGKFNNARKLPFRLAFLGAFLVAAITANAMYISTIERIEHIPFESLTLELQQQFNEQLAEANLALSVGDLQGSVALLNSAYDIHQTHDGIAELRDKILIQLDQAALSSEKSEFYQSQLNTLMEYPVFKDAK
jgi:hypothetical protein